MRCGMRCVLKLMQQGLKKVNLVSLAGQGKPYREPVTDLRVQMRQAALSQIM